MKKKLFVSILIFIFFCSPSLAKKKEETKKTTKKTKTTDSVTLGFFVQGDSISFFGDKIDVVRNRKNLKDGVNIPRARFYIRGKKGVWAYNLTFDAAEVLLRETYLRYEEYENFRFTIGQFKVPYSFWFLGSQARLNFLEQGLPTIAFNPGFRVGINTNFIFDPLNLSLGMVTTEANNTIQGNHIKGHTPLAGTGRLIFSPIHTEKEALHFATAAIFQDTDSLGRFRFRAFPEVQTYHNQFLVDTGFILHCKNYIGQEAEAAFILGPLTFEGEYYHTHVNRNPTDLNFEGFYLNADYFLTGENYVYNFKDGNIEKISKIRHWYGAWQIALRYSKLDLQDNGIKGGREQNTTFGLNWIANDNFRFMVNYILVDTFPSDNGLNRRVNILGLRCQISAESF